MPPFSLNRGANRRDARQPAAFRQAGYTQLALGERPADWLIEGQCSVFFDQGRQPSWLDEPRDPFFERARVIGQFRRKPFFCIRCNRREGPVLHRDGVLIVVGDQYFAVDFSCFGQLEIPWDERLISEQHARRALPFVRFRLGPIDEPETREFPNTD